MVSLNVGLTWSLNLGALSIPDLYQIGVVEAPGASLCTEEEFACTGTSKRHATAVAPVFELAEMVEGGGPLPGFGELLLRRPIAATALLPKSAVLFTAGAVAGALGEAPPAPTHVLY